MKISPYGLVALVILGVSAPILAFAEIENDATEGANEIKSQQAENEGSNENSANSANSDLILFVTVAAIASVVAYSTWKVYKARRRATSKTLV